MSTKEKEIYARTHRCVRYVQDERGEGGGEKVGSDDDGLNECIYEGPTGVTIFDDMVSKGGERRGEKPTIGGLDSKIRPYDRSKPIFTQSILIGI